MTAYTWTGAAGDSNFNNAANWSPQQVPGSADSVTISPAAALVLDVSTTLANVTTGASVTLTVGDYQTLQVGNGAATAKLVNGGTIALTGGHDVGLVLDAATTTLSGGGTIALSNQEIMAAATGQALVNTNNVIAGSGELGGGTLTFTNAAAGIVDANRPGTTLEINTGTVATANSGLLEATAGGNLQIDSSVKNLAHGAINADGGSVTLNGGTITGGTLSASNGGTFYDNGSATLDGGTAGLSLQGNLHVTDYSQLSLLGTLVNADTLSEDYVHGTGILIGVASGAAGKVTLTGGGTVTLASSLQAAQAGETLVNVDNTINGYDQLGNGTSLAIVNDAAGIIDATGNMVLNTGSITTVNAGLIEATGTAQNAGQLTISSTINNGAGGQIAAAGANVILTGGIAIEGGTLTSTNGGRLIASNYNSSSPVLDGTVHAITNDAYIEVTDYSGLLIKGTFINNGTLHNDYVHGAGIVIGSGTVFTNNGTLQANELNTTFGAGTKLTNDVMGTLTGGTYQTSNATLSFQAPAITVLGSGTTIDESNGAILFAGQDIAKSLRLIDAGATVIVENGSNSGTQALSNKGTLQLNGATYGLGKLTNTAGAAITGNGDVAASLTNAGLIEASGGALLLTGAVNSLGGTIAGGAGDFVGLGGSTTLLSSAVVTATDLAVLYNSSLHLAAKLSLGGTLQLNGLASVSGGALNLSGLLEQRGDGSGQGTIAAALTSSGTIQIDQGGTLSLPAGLTNSGTILANGGLVDSHALTGGTLSIGTYGSVSLATASSAASTLAVLDSAGGTLTTNGTLTVTGDYDNTAAGTGNGYAPFTGISGTIDGKATKLSVVGVEGTKITSVNGTETISVAPGGTAHFEIKNAGPLTAATLRGALQTTVNGGSITGTALSGSGVTAGNFGPIAGGATSGIYDIAYSGGGLSGEAIHIASDFANVAGITLDIVSSQAASAATLSLAQLHHDVSAADWLTAGLHH